MRVIDVTTASVPVGVMATVRVNKVLSYTAGRNVVTAVRVPTLPP